MSDLPANRAWSRTVAEMLRRTILLNELDKTSYGRVLVAEILQSVVNDLALEGLDTRELERALARMRVPDRGLTGIAGRGSSRRG